MEGYNVCAYKPQPNVTSLQNLNMVVDTIYVPHHYYSYFA